MAQLPMSVITTRSDQMFPTFDPKEIERICRFGTVASYRKGDAVARVGELPKGLIVILSGKIEVTRRDASGRSDSIVVHQAGSFMGELAQLSRPPPR